ncbi:MAG: hypothetical protein GY950_35050 [bacterium]|nr:hypothetical protein [bacterium]
MKRKTMKIIPNQSVKQWFPVLLILFGMLFALRVPLHPDKPLYTYYNFSFGARALSMGNAFTAAADDLSAVFWNPAGIAQFNRPEAYLSYGKDKMLYDYESEIFDAGSGINRYDYNFDSRLKNIDFLSVSVPAYFWDMKWTFALSYYRLIPYNMEGKSTSNADFGDPLLNYSSTVNFSGESGIDVLAFTAAYHYSDYFSLGITVQQCLNSGTTRYQYLYNDYYGQLEDNETYTERLEGRNLILGFIFKPLEDVIIGMTYRTKLSNKFHSEYTGAYQTLGASGIETSTAEGAFRADAVLPARLSLGVLVRLFPWMRLTIDYSIIYWSLGTLSEDYGITEEVQYPVRSDYTFSQEDAVNYRMGVEFTIPVERINVFLRGGLFTEQPLFTDSSANVVKLTGCAVGLGLDLSGMTTIDLAYMRQKGDWTEAGYLGTEFPVFTHYKNDIVKLSVTFRFGRIKQKP